MFDGDDLYLCLQHTEANHRIVRNFTSNQENVMAKTQEYEDMKMREYKDKGIFNENLELIPKKPKTAEELELELVKSYNSPFLLNYVYPSYKYFYPE